MREMRKSARAMAVELDIHHSTFQDYLMGRHRPAPYIRKRIARLARVPDFDTLVDRQMQQHYGKFYEGVCERRQQRKSVVQERVNNAMHAGVAETSAEQMTVLEAYMGLSEDEARYFGAKLRTQKAELERERKKMADQLEVEAQYHADDRLAAELIKARLDHSKAVLAFLEAKRALPEVIEAQRNAVNKLQKEYNSLRLRVDTLSNTAPLFARLALGEMDAAIRLRGEALEVLAARGAV